MCVPVYVCVSVCVYVCMYLSVCLCVCICLCVCVVWGVRAVSVRISAIPERQQCHGVCSCGVPCQCAAPALTTVNTHTHTHTSNQSRHTSDQSRHTQPVSGQCPCRAACESTADGHSARREGAERNAKSTELLATQSPGPWLNETPEINSLF